MTKMDPPRGHRAVKRRVGESEQWGHVPTSKQNFTAKRSTAKMSKDNPITEILPWEGLPKLETVKPLQLTPWRIAPVSAESPSEDSTEEEAEQFPSLPEMAETRESHKRWEELPKLRAVKPPPQKIRHALRVTEQAVEVFR